MLAARFNASQRPAAAGSVSRPSTRRTAKAVVAAGMAGVLLAGQLLLAPQAMAKAPFQGAVSNDKPEESYNWATPGADPKVAGNPENSLGNPVDDINNSIRETATGKISQPVKTLTDKGSEIKSNSGDIASGAKGIAGNAASGLKSKVAGAKGALGGAKDKIQDALPDSPGDAISDAKDAAKEGASAVKGKLGKAPLLHISLFDIAENSADAAASGTKPSPTEIAEGLTPEPLGPRLKQGTAEIVEGVKNKVVGAFTGEDKTETPADSGLGADRTFDNRVLSGVTPKGQGKAPLLHISFFDIAENSADAAASGTKPSPTEIAEGLTPEPVGPRLKQGTAEIVEGVKNKVVGAFTGNEQASAGKTEDPGLGSDRTFDNRVLSKVTPKLPLSFIPAAADGNAPAATEDGKVPGEVDRGGYTKTKAAISNTTIKASKVLGIAAEQLGDKVGPNDGSGPRPTAKESSIFGGADISRPGISPKADAKPWSLDNRPTPKKVGGTASTETNFNVGPVPDSQKDTGAQVLKNNLPFNLGEAVRRGFMSTDPK
ncbi:hypothetical protein N2152v2_004244 [Parachlorella kessleri]